MKSFGVRSSILKIKGRKETTRRSLSHWFFRIQYRTSDVKYRFSCDLFQLKSRLRHFHSESVALSLSVDMPCFWSPIQNHFVATLNSSRLLHNEKWNLLARFYDRKLRAVLMIKRTVTNWRWMSCSWFWMYLSRAGAARWRSGNWQYTLLTENFYDCEHDRTMEFREQFFKLLRI